MVTIASGNRIFLDGYEGYIKIEDFQVLEVLSLYQSPGLCLYVVETDKILNNFDGLNHKLKNRLRLDSEFNLFYINTVK